MPPGPLLAGAKVFTKLWGPEELVGSAPLDDDMSVPDTLDELPVTTSEPQFVAPATAPTPATRST